MGSNDVPFAGRLGLHVSEYLEQERLIAPHEIFDNLGRILGSGLPRRKVFKLVLSGLAGAVLSELGVKSAWAAGTCLCRGQTYNPVTACCTPTGVQNKNPITNLSACPNRVHSPSFPGAVPNGCGAEGGTQFPNAFGLANFRPCCNNHDICYGTCIDLTGTSKTSCDNTFGSCLTFSCAANVFFPSLIPTCLAVAAAYRAAVGIFGTGPYETAQSGACDCCGTSTCPQTCAGSACGSLPSCAGGGDCVCFTSTEGTGACVHGATPCSAVSHCSTTADCPAGTACLTTSCCGSFGVCGPLCNPIVQASQSVPLAARSQALAPRTQSGVPTLGGF